MVCTRMKWFRGPVWYAEVLRGVLIACVLAVCLDERAGRSSVEVLDCDLSRRYCLQKRHGEPPEGGGVAT